MMGPERSFFVLRFSRRMFARVAFCHCALQRDCHPRSSVLGLLSPQLVADRRWQLSPETAKSAILLPHVVLS